MTRDYSNVRVGNWSWAENIRSEAEVHPPIDALRHVESASVTYRFKIAQRSFKLAFMRVMVSLNLADIMTATRPTQPVYETPGNEADPTDLPTDSEEMQRTQPSAVAPDQTSNVTP